MKLTIDRGRALADHSGPRRQRDDVIRRERWARARLSVGQAHPPAGRAPVAIARRSDLSVSVPA